MNLIGFWCFGEKRKRFLGVFWCSLSFTWKISVFDIRTIVLVYFLSWCSFGFRSLFQRPDPSDTACFFFFLKRSLKEAAHPKGGIWLTKTCRVTQSVKIAGKAW